MSQLYNGNRYEPAPVEGAPLARNVAAEDIAIGMGRVAQNVDAVSHGLLRHADESQKLDDALELRRVRAEAKTLMEERLNLRDGDPDALFREDGSPNKPAISELMKPFAARLDKVGRRLLNPEERAQMRFNADAAWVDLENGAYQMAEAASRARRDRKLGDGYKLAMETGDFEGAAMFARAGAETGSWTPEQAELMAVNARRGAVEDKIYGLTENDPEAAFDCLYGSDGGVLTPQRRLQLGEALRAKLKQRDAARLDDFFSPMPSSIRDELKEGGKAQSGKNRNAPEFWGTHSQQEIVWLHAVKNGQAAEVLPAVRGHAMAEAMAMSPNMAYDSVAQEKARAEFEARYLYYGMNKEDVTRIWNEGMKNLEYVHAGGINPKMRLKAAYDGGQLFNQDIWAAWEKSWKRDEDGKMTFEEFGKDGYARLRWGAAAGVSEKDDAAMAYAKIAKLKQVNMQAETQGRILERYAAWADTKEGGQATPLQQMEKLNNLAAAETGHAVSVGSVEDLQALKKQSLYGQSKAYDEFTSGNARRFREEQAEEESDQPWRKVDVGYDTERKDLPRGILVPEEMLQGKNMDEVVYDMIFDNEHFLRLPVVGTTKGDAPVMTYATAREAGRMPDSVYTVKGKLRSGDSSVLLDEVERPVGSVRYGTGRYVTGQWAGALNPQRVPVALRPYLQDFLEAGAQYGVNPALLVAISMHETGDGTSAAFRTKKNAMGVSDSRGVLQMPSVRSSVFRMAKALGQKEHYKGRSLREIAKVYAPVGAENDLRGLNGGWLSGVSAKLKTINK